MYGLEEFVAQGQRPGPLQHPTALYGLWETVVGHPSHILPAETSLGMSEILKFQ